MLFKLTEKRRLQCYGLGIIEYNDSLMPVLGYTEVDSCIKSIENGYYDLGVTDSRDIERCASVKMGTLTSMTIISLSALLSYATYKYISKR